MSFIAKGIKSLFGLNTPKLPDPPPAPPSTPSRADASLVNRGRSSSNIGLRSLVNTSAQGLNRKANTAKRSLLGGS